MRRIATAALFVLCALPWIGAFDDPPVVEWIRAHAVRLETPEAGHGFADMQPLKKMIGNARIVSLGEATHGTREFFQLKHRLLEFLATEMGFTIFSIETNMPEAYRLNDFVLSGSGDPAKLLRGMYFWTWDTQEVLDMILWMREFNKSSKGRVEFTGFDMQTPNVAMEIARDFVAKADPDYAAAVRQASDQASSVSRAANGASFGVATRFFPNQRCGGQARPLQRLHQDGRRHARLGGALVARRRPIGRPRLRQHAEPRRDQDHGLETIRARTPGGSRGKEHQFRRNPFGRRRGLV